MRGFSVIPKKIAVLFVLVFVTFSLIEVKMLLDQKNRVYDQKSQQVRTYIGYLSRRYLKAKHEYWYLSKSNASFNFKARNNDLRMNISNEELNGVMNWRVQNMREACEYHGLDKIGEDLLHQPNPWEYLIAKHDNVNLFWCNVFKSGSSRYDVI